MGITPLDTPIALDISALNPDFRESHVTRGIGRYVRHLQENLLKLPETKELLGYFDHCELLKNSKISKAIDYLPYGKVTARQQLLYPFVLNSAQFSKVKFLHFPAHMDAAAWGIKPYILTVLDLIPIILKDLYAPEVFNWRFKLARFLELRAIKGAAHIVAISQTTADDLTRVLKISPEKITVTPLAVDEKFFVAGQTYQEKQSETLPVLEKFKIESTRPILLYVGGIDARKNIKQLLRLEKALADRAELAGRSKPQLVLAGSIMKDKNFPALQAEIKELNLENDVKITGFLTDDELFKLYRSANLFCFLSLYEGFGLPPLEAMAVGTPVLSSNRSCLPEVLGSAALFSDPDDLSNLVALAEEILSNAGLQENFRRLGLQQAQKFSWQGTAEKTLAVYQKLLESQKTNLS